MNWDTTVYLLVFLSSLPRMAPELCLKDSRTLLTHSSEFFHILPVSWVQTPKNPCSQLYQPHTSVPVSCGCGKLQTKATLTPV